jgi:thiol-disulfide isomerase/thioredoxin
MNRTVRWVVAIVLLQAMLVGVYWLVEHQRASKTEEPLGMQPPQRVNKPLPSLTVVHHDGSRAELSPLDRRTLVHVWATWCPPCRTELPGLLALSSQHDVNVVAIALDQSWGTVDRFLGPISSSQVVLAASDDVERKLGVRTLPVTFLVKADGRIALRFDGTRDWTDEAFVRTHVEE